MFVMREAEWAAQDCLTRSSRRTCSGKISLARIRRAVHIRRNSPLKNPRGTPLGARLQAVTDAGSLLFWRRRGCVWQRDRRGT